ncbi:AraC family transcriptional regulator [Subtercola sp. YIM 133946]|uniref:AraC family transcriptional regulator n=1 Tax=Subtercola sp. YIM 133946 TaxID=3118909 RepID=UPI002F954520
MLHSTRYDWQLIGESGLNASPGHATSPDPASYRNVGASWKLGEATVSVSRQTPHEVTVGDEVADEPGTSVTVVFIRQGRWRLTEGSTSLSFAGGDAGFIGPSALVLGRNIDTSLLTSISLPFERVHDLVDVLPVGIGAFGDGMLRDPSLSFIRGLVEVAKDQPIPAGPAESVLTQLVAGMFLEQSGYRMDSVGLERGLVARAKALINAQYSDSGLTPTAVAAQLNVSVRHLQRSFAQTGDTLADAIRARRLEAAVRDIESSRRSIPDVALRAGFASTGELRRALRTVHATTPSDLRRASVGVPVADG